MCVNILSRHPVEDRVSAHRLAIKYNHPETAEAVLTTKVGCHIDEQYSEKGEGTVAAALRCEIEQLNQQLGNAERDRDAANRLNADYAERLACVTSESLSNDRRPSKVPDISSLPMGAHQTMIFEAKLALKDHISGVSKALKTMADSEELKNDFGPEVSKIRMLNAVWEESKDAVRVCWSAMASYKALPFAGYEVTRDVGHAGLSGPEAVELMERYLQSVPAAQNAANRLQVSFKLNFIVGRGNGSGPSGPVVGLAVRKYLQDSEIPFVEDQASKGGMISVILSPEPGSAGDDSVLSNENFNRMFDLPE